MTTLYLIFIVLLLVVIVFQEHELESERKEFGRILSSLQKPKKNKLK